ncbi:MAG: O-antigen ligase family protein [Anaerolineae bacterium]
MSRWYANLTGRLAWLALLALAFLAPFQPSKALFRSQYSELHTAGALALLAVGLWLLHLLLARRGPRLSLPLTLALSAFLVIADVATIAAPSNRLDAAKFVVGLALGSFICVAVTDLAAEPRRRVQLALAVIVGATVVAALGLGEYAAIGPVLRFLTQFRPASTQVGDVVRVSSTFIYPTITSMYLELALPFILAGIWLAQRARWHMTLIALMVVFALVAEAIIITFTRTGLLSTAVVVIFMAGARWWYERRVSARQIAAAGVTVVVLLGVTTLLTPALSLRLRTENDRAWYGAEYTPDPLPTLAAGEQASVNVRVVNTGEMAWRPTNGRPISVSYHWLAHNEDSVAEWEGARAPIEDVVEPGETITVTLPIVAPSQSGPFRLAFDMVQDNVTWFSAKAVPMHVVPVEIGHRRNQPAVQPAPIRLAPMPAASSVDLSPGRRTLWAVALSMVRDRPLLGVGPDNFRFAYGRYTGQTVWDTGLHTNNMYIEMFADTGVFGGLLFLALNIVALWIAIRGMQAVGRAAAANREIEGYRPGRDLRADAAFAVAAAAAAGLIAWAIHGFVDYFYEFLPLVLIYWIILGLAASGAVHVLGEGATGALDPRSDPQVAETAPSPGTHG